MIDVLWLHQAMLDLKTIGTTISKHNKRAAYETLVRIKASADMLGNHPHMGRQGRVEGTRELSIPNIPYIIAYKVYEDAVRILAILHTARKWPLDFNEEEDS